MMNHTSLASGPLKNLKSYNGSSVSSLISHSVPSMTTPKILRQWFSEKSQILQLRFYE